ncbi:MAG: OmpA family protein [Candidatus Rokubacteria bacterium]|nr:OmpA family protein [Candidatus Rokubacteria bacterium]
MQGDRAGLNIWIGFADLFVGLMLFVVGGLIITLQQFGRSAEDVRFSMELVRTLNMATEITRSIQDELEKRLSKDVPAPVYGETEIIIPSAALFRSFGYDDFLYSADRQELLVAIGETLREVLGRARERRRFLRIVIEGHTDSDPIKSEAVTPAIPSNWELAARRATGVLRFLESLGVDAKDYKLIATGLADTVPVADNESEEGKARNRRIVIRVEPDIGAIRAYVSGRQQE